MTVMVRIMVRIMVPSRFALGGAGELAAVGADACFSNVSKESARQD
ncbi:MAG: hypothetical protein M3313_08265 [Actinomycetota bacterium]|nr:hypothetical protein [Actinomycetota bacterium]